jgi:hypothetical protein
MTTRVFLGLVVVASLALSGCSGLNEGESCDPTLASRDCDEELLCTYSYDECPQYGCAKCRRPCRTHADCPAKDGCDAVCVQQEETDERGVCKICPGYRPWFPP